MEGGRLKRWHTWSLFGMAPRTTGDGSSGLHGGAVRRSDVAAGLHSGCPVLVLGEQGNRAGAGVAQVLWPRLSSSSSTVRIVRKSFAAAVSHRLHAWLAQRRGRVAAVAALQRDSPERERHITSRDTP